MAVVAGVFLLQKLLLNWWSPRAFAGFMEVFELAPSSVFSGKIWTLVTYGFLHDVGTYLHVVCNLLGLYFFGRVLLPMIGSRRFLTVYFSAAVLGGLVWLAGTWVNAALFGGNLSVGLIGASASVCALFVAFALMAPDRPLRFLLFFVFPVVLRPRQIALGMLIFEGVGFLGFELSGNGFGIAHSAHLGGMLAGWLCYRIFRRQDERGFASSRAEIEEPAWWRRVRSKKMPEMRSTVNMSSPESVRAEVDRILDKISSRGFQSLTDEEKQTLDSARDLLKPR